MAAPETPEAYEARLVAFLRTRPDGVCALAVIGNLCRWEVAAGVPGAYANFVRARPHLFRFLDGGKVQLIQDGQPAGAAPAAGPPPAPGTPSLAALEAACVAYLRLRVRVTVSHLGTAVPRPAGAPPLTRFLRERPHLFALAQDAARPGTFYVSLVVEHAAGGGGAQRCAVCGTGPFTSSVSRREHEAGRPHLLKVAASLLQPKLGVSLSGPAELRSEAGAAASVSLALRNSGVLACTLLRTRLLRYRRDVRARCAVAGAAVALPRGASVDVLLEQGPQQAGVSRVMVICHLRFASGLEATIGHELWLRCASAASAEDMAFLKPTSAYRRGRRPPPPSSAPDMCTAATFRASPLPDAEATAAVMHEPIAQLCTAAQATSGPLASMVAAWLAPKSPPAASGAAMTATVVMDGVPSAAQFGLAHRTALAAVLAALLRVAEVEILSVAPHPAAVVPGVPLGSRSQGIHLTDVNIPQSLRQELDAPADSPLRGALTARLAAPLTAATHSARFKELLLCEEVQQQRDIRMYDIEAAVMRTLSAVTLLLVVPGLAESRPSVLRGDKVMARVAGDAQGRHFEGVVHGVEQETLQLRFDLSFHRNFIAGMKFHVQFRLRRTPMLLMHAAVAPELHPDALLFPCAPADEAAEAAAARAAALPVPLHNPKLNERQQQAVRAALCAGASADSPLVAPYVVFGPPGTGKTSTVAEYVLQTLARARQQEASKGSGNVLSSLMAKLTLQSSKPDVLILIAAPSNSAVDTLARRLVQPLGPLPASELLRVNAYQRPKAAVPTELTASSRWSEADGAFLLPASMADLRGVRVVAATCTTAQKLAKSKSNAFRTLFTHIAVDEAGQATEPECLCAVAQLLRPAHERGARLLLAGDPRQLGPVLRSALAAEAGLALSWLERLTMRDGPHQQQAAGAYAELDGFHPAFVTLLTHNYRSHPALLHVPNTCFYGGALVARADAVRANAMCTWSGLTDAARAVPGGFPLLFHGVEGEDMREGNSPSWFNPQEAGEVLQHVRSVLDAAGSGVKAADIGVITPYHKQKLKIAELLRKHGLEAVRVGSVEEFQGAERAVVILSAVRSSHEHVAFDTRHALGFLCNPKRFNVAITRACALLVVVGNPAVLSADANWAALLRHAVRHGAYRGCALPPGFDDGGNDDGGADEADGVALLRRVAEEEEARGAAEQRAEADAARAMEEGPAWPNEG